MKSPNLVFAKLSTKGMDKGKWSTFILFVRKGKNKYLHKYDTFQSEKRQLLGELALQTWVHEILSTEL
jgi:hypothetical protein